MSPWRQCRSQSTGLMETPQLVVWMARCESPTCLSVYHQKKKLHLFPYKTRVLPVQIQDNVDQRLQFFALPNKKGHTSSSSSAHFHLDPWSSGLNPYAFLWGYLKYLDNKNKNKNMCDIVWINRRIPF